MKWLQFTKLKICNICYINFQIEHWCIKFLIKLHIVGFGNEIDRKQVCADSV